MKLAKNSSLNFLAIIIWYLKTEIIYAGSYNYQDLGITSNGAFRIYITSSPCTWTESENFCIKAFSTHLASIHSSSDGTNIWNTRSSSGYSSNSYWIGLRYNTSSSSWYWSDKSKCNYTSWDSGEPNNLGLENYVHYLGSKQTWNNAYDITSSDVYGLVCNYVAPTYKVIGITSNGKYLLILASTIIQWTEAESYCLSQYGQHLGSIHSSSDNSSIWSLISSIGYTSYGFWIGLNDAATSNTYVWSDGTSYNWYNWNTNEPNDFNEWESYIAIWGGTPGWNDLPNSGASSYNSVASIVRGFVCNNVPTSAPTRVPTKIPTRVPTKNPTGVPTKNPTGVPTRNPTGVPTKNPTGVPTRNPTGVPTRNPTEVPTRNPTGVPTKNPTGAPTKNPTGVPTSAPTGMPTLFPTNAPTLFPTIYPTNAPTLSPTIYPTNVPTLSPTIYPTFAPTTAPTMSPEIASTLILQITRDNYTHQNSNDPYLIILLSVLCIVIIMGILILVIYCSTKKKTTEKQETETQHGNQIIEIRQGIQKQTGHDNTKEEEKKH